MRRTRSPLALAVLLAGIFSPLAAQTIPVPESYRLEQDGDEPPAQTPVAHSRYPGLILTAQDDGGRRLPDFGGWVALEGFRLALRADLPQPDLAAVARHELTGGAEGDGSPLATGERYDEGGRLIAVLFREGIARITADVVYDASARVTGLLRPGADGRGGEVLDPSYAAPWFREPAFGWVSLLPPLIAILAAVVLRRVLVALLLGILSGAVLLERDPLSALLRTFDRHIWAQIVDGDHLRILGFTAMLGAMVALLAKLGGVRAIVDALSRRGRGGRGAQVSTWLMGIFVFFDDYANALLVGNTMRPVTDRYRISREKLAYLVDSTSAPVTCIAVISTWIAGEIGYIAEWLEGSEGLAGYGPGAAYQVFLDSVVYNFYPIFALLFAFLIAVSGRDFGPMLRAERRARSTGALLAEGARPLSRDDGEHTRPADPGRLRWWNGVLPMAVVIFGVLGGLYYDGWRQMPALIHDLRHEQIAEGEARLERLGEYREGVAIGRLAPPPRLAADASALVRQIDVRLEAERAVLEHARAELDLAERAYAEPARGHLFSGFAEVRTLYGNARSTEVLLWASAAGLLLAILLAAGQRFLGPVGLLSTCWRGVLGVAPALMVLTLAWALSDLCKSSLNTAGYLVEQVPLGFEWLPVCVFLLSAVVGFSTGSSWGTMGILVPLTMAFVAGLGEGRPDAEIAPVLLASLGGVLAGAVFGDHCSPISDTTVMSSMASGSDHVDHVKTQMPYALVVAVIAVAFGYLPAGFGMNPGWCLLLGAIAITLTLAVLGRRSEPAGAGEQTRP